MCICVYIYISWKIKNKIKKHIKLLFRDIFLKCMDGQYEQ